MADTPISIMSRFETEARDDFQRRLDKVKRTAFEYLTHAHQDPRFDVRELFRALCLMSDQERYVLLDKVIHNSDGPATLEGMEALCSFVGNYMLDDGLCVVVLEPHDPENDPYFQALAAQIGHGAVEEGLTEAQAHRRAMEIYLERDRPMVVLPRMTDDGPGARAPEVLAAIRHNRALEERRRQAYAEFLGEDDPDLGAPLPSL